MMHSYNLKSNVPTRACPTENGHKSKHEETLKTEIDLSIKENVYWNTF